MITMQPYQPYQPYMNNKPAFKSYTMNSSLERFVDQTPELRSELDRLASQASGDLKVIARKVEDGFVNGFTAEILIKKPDGSTIRVGELEAEDLPHTIGQYSTKFRK